MSKFCSVLSVSSEVFLGNIGVFRWLLGSWSIWAWPSWRSRGAGFVLSLSWFRPNGGTEATTWCDCVTGTVVTQVIGTVLLWSFAYLTLWACLVWPAN